MLTHDTVLSHSPLRLATGKRHSRGLAELPDQRTQLFHCHKTEIRKFLECSSKVKNAKLREVGRSNSLFSSIVGNIRVIFVVSDGNILQVRAKKYNARTRSASTVGTVEQTKAPALHGEFGFAKFSLFGHSHSGGGGLWRDQRGFK